jgi:hypothetical protein
MVFANYASSNIAVYVNSSAALDPHLALNISYTGSNYVLSWPAWAANSALQATNSLTPPVAWTNVPVTLETNGDTIQTTVPMCDQQSFFRLYLP